MKVNLLEPGATHFWTCGQAAHSGFGVHEALPDCLLTCNEVCGDRVRVVTACTACHDPAQWVGHRPHPKFATAEYAGMRPSGLPGICYRCGGHQSGCDREDVGQDGRCKSCGGTGRCFKCRGTGVWP